MTVRRGLSLVVVPFCASDSDSFKVSVLHGREMHKSFKKLSALF